MAALDLDHAGHAAPFGTGKIRLDQASAGYLLTHEPDAGVRKQVSTGTKLKRLAWNLRQMTMLANVEAQCCGRPAP